MWLCGVTGPSQQTAEAWKSVSFSAVATAGELGYEYKKGMRGDVALLAV
jgi:hypothetical protein